VVAGPITLPTGLNPGGQYRLPFVTSGERQSDTSDIAVYNTYVSDAANAVPELFSLGTTWIAIASTSDVNARDNTDTLPSFAGGVLGFPIYRLDGIKIVDSYDDLWDGTLDAALQVDEQGTTLTPALGSTIVWTGSRVESILEHGGLGPPDPPGVGDRNGSFIAADSNWTNFNTVASPPHIARFSGISGVLKAPAVPEPGSLLLLSILTVVLLGYGVVRKRKRT